MTVLLGWWTTRGNYS